MQKKHDKILFDSHIKRYEKIRKLKQDQMNISLLVVY